MIVNVNMTVMIKQEGNYNSDMYTISEVVEEKLLLSRQAIASNFLDFLDSD